MSGKLDQSLDQIMKDGPSTGNRRASRPSARRAAQKAKAAIAAPTGGVQKSARGPRSTTKVPTMAAPRAPAPTRGSHKVLVTMLPPDVDATQLKVR